MSISDEELQTLKKDIESGLVMTVIVEHFEQLEAENDRLRDTLRKIADQANRATMVQDRSVRIIKQTCGVIFSEAKQALKG